MNTNPFQAFDLHQDRLVWDPSVHAEYDEHCYYFLLRLRDPEIEIGETLRGLLVQSGVESSCTYILYGYFDVLIRLWATHQKRGRFVRRLAEKRELVEDVKEFQAHAIDYLWATQSPSLTQESFLAFRSQVEDVTNATKAGNSPDTNKIKQLCEAGLLHRLPSRDVGSIKFYIALSRIPGPIESKNDLERLKALLKDDSLPLKDVSLYSGIGFCNHLVKAVVDNYPDIVKASMRLFKEARRLNLRPMTLLIANNDAPESDQIDPAWEDLPVNLMQLELLLGPGSGSLIAGLPVDGRTAVANFFGDHFSFLGTPFEGIFRALILARLQNDGEMLSEKLAFLMRLEGLLRKFFVELCSTTFPNADNWYSQVVAKAKEASIDPKKNPAKDYTLHDIITVMDKLSAEGMLNSEAVAQVLGAGWKARLEEIKELRNDFAHGRFFEPSQLRKLVEADWYKFAQRVAGVGSIYNSLVSKYTDSVK